MRETVILYFRDIFISLYDELSRSKMVVDDVFGHTYNLDITGEIKVVWYRIFLEAARKEMVLSLLNYAARESEYPQRVIPCQLLWYADQIVNEMGLELTWLKEIYLECVPLHKRNQVMKAQEIDLVLILKSLWDFPDKSPILEFLIQLGNLAPEELRLPLFACAQKALPNVNSTEKRELLRKRLAPEPSNSKSISITIELKPTIAETKGAKHHEEHYQMRLFRWESDDKGHLIPTKTTALTLDEARIQLDLEIQKIIQQTNLLEEIILEFVLPNDLLLQTKRAARNWRMPDQWLFPGDKNTTFGERYTVVYRSLKRMLASPQWLKWRERGMLSQEQNQFRWLEHPHEFLNQNLKTEKLLFYELNSEKQCKGLGCFFPLAKHEFLFEQILEAGISVALWSRKESPLSIDEIKSKIISDVLHRLPQEFYEWRRTGHTLPKYLTLLWDTPKRNPYEDRHKFKI